MNEPDNIEIAIKWFYRVAWCLTCFTYFLIGFVSVDFLSGGCRIITFTASVRTPLLISAVPQVFQ